jgi:hypothetical protein
MQDHSELVENIDTPSGIRTHNPKPMSGRKQRTSRSALMFSFREHFSGSCKITRDAARSTWSNGRTRVCGCTVVFLSIICASPGGQGCVSARLYFYPSSVHHQSSSLPFFVFVVIIVTIATEQRGTDKSRCNIQSNLNRNRWKISFPTSL